MSKPRKNPLKVLGFEPHERPSKEDLAAARKTMTKKYYKAAQTGDQEATKKLSEVNAAYTYLTEGEGAEQLSQTGVFGKGASLHEFLKREAARKNEGTPRSKSKPDTQTQGKNGQVPQQPASSPHKVREKLEEGFAAFLGAVAQNAPKARDEFKQRAQKFSGYLASGDLEKRMGHTEPGRRVSGILTAFGKAVNERLSSSDGNAKPGQKRPPRRPPGCDDNKGPDSGP